MKIWMSLAAAIAAASIAAPGAAVTVSGAKSIRIQNAIPTWLQVGEVQAFQAHTGTNVALASNGGTAIGSGNFSPASNPGKAIDGLAPRGFPDIYHSDSDNAAEFLRITFAAPTDLASFAIFGRSDGNFSRDFFAVTIFDSLGATLFSRQFDNRTLAGVGNTVTFDVGPAPIPEPASWALMICGFGMVGGAMRRRNRAGVHA